MSDLKLDLTFYDLDLNGPDLVFLEGLDAIEQHMRIRLSTIQGEFFLDSAIGMPYYEEFFSKAPVVRSLAAIIRQAVETTPGVTAIRNLSIGTDASTRKTEISFEAQAGDLGTIVYNERFVLS